MGRIVYSTSGVILLYTLGFALSFWLLSPGAALVNAAPLASLFPSMASEGESVSWITVVPAWLTAFATVILAASLGIALKQYQHNRKTQQASFLAELHRRAFREDPDLLSALYYIDYHHRGYPVLRFCPLETPARGSRDDKFCLEAFPALATEGQGGGEEQRRPNPLQPQEGRPIEWCMDKLLSFFQLLGALSSRELGLLDPEHVKAIFGYHLANALLHPAVYTYLEFLTSRPQIESEIPLEFRDFKRLAKEVIRERRQKGSPPLRRPIMLVSTEPLREEFLFCAPADQQLVQELVKISSNAKEEKVSERLRNLFHKHGYSISAWASVKPEKDMYNEWRIRDRDATDRPVKREFTVRLVRDGVSEGEEGRKLAVYEKESSVLLRIAYEAIEEVLSKDDCWDLFPQDFSENLKDKRILIARTPDEKEELIGYIIFVEKEEEGEKCCTSTN